MPHSSYVSTSTPKPPASVGSYRLAIATIARATTARLAACGECHAAETAAWTGSHETREADQDVLHALVGLHLQTGNIEAARTYLRKLQQIRPWYAQIDELLRRLGNDS